MLQAEELVQYFYKVFHGVDAHVPQSKETGQALSLVSQHGWEQSRHIVEFARDEAARTNYQVQHFGAVLSYSSRGLAVWDRQRLQAAPRNPEPPIAEPDVVWIRGQSRLAVMTPEQCQARIAKAKAELREQSPFLAQQWKDGNQTYERMIRARVIRQLGAEPMDLMAPPPWLPARNRNDHRPQNLPL
jgi:hypothetical protein